MSPGDLVVCVNTGIIEGAGNDPEGRRLLRVGDVYEVIDVLDILGWSPAFAVKVRDSVLGVSGWFHSDRFRPCRKTDISSLEALTKEREGVDVL